MASKSAVDFIGGVEERLVTDHQRTVIVLTFIPNLDLLPWFRNEILTDLISDEEIYLVPYKLLVLSKLSKLFLPFLLNTKNKDTDLLENGLEDMGRGRGEM